MYLWLCLGLVSVCYIFLIGAEDIALEALAVLVFARVVFKLKIMLTSEILAMCQIHERAKWNTSLLVMSLSDLG